MTWKPATWLVWTGPCSIFLEQTQFCPFNSGELCPHAQRLMSAADAWPGLWADVCKEMHIPCGIVELTENAWDRLHSNLLTCWTLLSPTLWIKRQMAQVHNNELIET